MLWLGERRGYATDWLTQRWVQATGRRVDLNQDDWLGGPVGNPRGIGPRYFHELAEHERLTLCADGAPRGLVGRFDALSGPGFDPEKVDPLVADFYVNTSVYDLDAWAEWCGFFRPFGHVLAILFSRRLQQLGGFRGHNTNFFLTKNIELD